MATLQVQEIPPNGCIEGAPLTALDGTAPDDNLNDGSTLLMFLNKDTVDHTVTIDGPKEARFGCELEKVISVPANDGTHDGVSFAGPFSTEWNQAGGKLVYTADSNLVCAVPVRIATRK